MSASIRSTSLHALALLLVGGFSAGLRAANVTLIATDAAGASSFNTGLNWSDATAPSAGNDYFTGAFALRTPATGTAFTFAGNSLSLDTGGSFIFKVLGPITVNNLILNGGTLLHGDVGTTQIATLAGGLTVNADSILAVGGANARFFSIGSLLAGSANLSLTGTAGVAGSTTLTNNGNTFTGAFSIGSGHNLIVGTLGNGGVASALGMASSAADRLAFNGGTLTYNGAAAASTDRRFTVGAAGGRLNASGAANVAITWGNTGAVTYSGSGARTLTLGGTSTGANLLAASIGDADAATSLTKADAGRWNLPANHTYTGATTISGGTLQFGNNGSTGAPGSGAISVASGATLQFRRNDTALVVPNDISGAGQVQIGAAGGTTKTGLITFTGNNSFTGNVTIFEGRLRITGSDDLGSGAKTITLNNGTNGNPGLVLDGSLGAISLPSTMSFTVSSSTAPGGIVSQAGANVINGNFTFTAGGGNTRFEAQSGASLTLNGNMSVTASGPRGPVLEGAGNGFLNGQITQNSAANFGAVTKNGAGTWTLGHANHTYTGATTVNAGTLALSNATTANNISTSALVDVKAGATLDVTGLQGGALALSSGQTLRGAGTVAGGLIVNLGAILSPGASPGTQVTGSQTWAPGGAYTWELDKVDPLTVSQLSLRGTNDGADWADIRGALTITADSATPFVVNITGLQANDAAGPVQAWNPALNYDWVIATATGGITGFNPASFQIGTANFANNNTVDGIFSLRTAGNDLILGYVAIPEPATGGLLLGGLLLLRRLAPVGGRIRE